MIDQWYPFFACKYLSDSKRLLASIKDGAYQVLSRFLDLSLSFVNYSHLFPAPSIIFKVCMSTTNIILTDLLFEMLSETSLVVCIPTAKRLMSAMNLIKHTQRHNTPPMSRLS